MAPGLSVSFLFSLYPPFCCVWSKARHQWIEAQQFICFPPAEPTQKLFLSCRVGLLKTVSFLIFMWFCATDGQGTKLFTRLTIKWKLPNSETFMFSLVSIEITHSKLSYSVHLKLNIFIVCTSSNVKSIHPLFVSESGRGVQQLHMTTPKIKLGGKKTMFLKKRLKGISIFLPPHCII